MKFLKKIIIVLIILETLGLATIYCFNITNLGIIFGTLGVAILVLIAALGLVYDYLGIHGIAGMICLLYLIISYLCMDFYLFLGTLFVFLALICIYSIKIIKGQFKIIKVRDLINEKENSETIEQIEVVLISFSLIFFLAGTILILSPYINQYIYSLDNTSNSGDIINNSATAIIISTTLGLALFTPMFSHILTTMKKSKTENYQKRIKELEKENEELKKKQGE